MTSCLQIPHTYLVKGIQTNRHTYACMKRCHDVRVKAIMSDSLHCASVESEL